VGTCRVPARLSAIAEGSRPATAETFAPGRLWEAWSLINGDRLRHVDSAADLAVHVCAAVFPRAGPGGAVREWTARLDPAAMEAVAFDVAAGGDPLAPAAALRPPPAGRFAPRFWSPAGDRFERQAAAKFATTIAAGQDLRLIAPPRPVGELRRGLDEATGLLERALPGFAPDLLRSASRAGFVGGAAPFLSGTALGIPRMLFVAPRLLDDPLRLAEHLLHESVHLLLNRTYLEFTPVRRAVATGRSPRICAVWHNQSLDSSDPAGWWDLELSFQAFVVYAHLATLHRALLGLDDARPFARTAFGTALFCAHYLGSRLLGYESYGLTPRSAALVRALLARLPLTGGVERGLERFAGRGTTGPEDGPGWHLSRTAPDPADRVAATPGLSIGLGSDGTALVYHPPGRMFRLSGALRRTLRRVDGSGPPVSVAELERSPGPSEAATLSVADQLVVLADLGLVTIAANSGPRPSRPDIHPGWTARQIDTVLRDHVFVDGVTLAALSRP
jgi:hypothetical protein